MSLLIRMADRFYRAFAQELGVWNLYEYPFGAEPFVVIEENRARVCLDKDFWTTLPAMREMRFGSRAAAMSFVHILAIRQGLIHLLCFWRKEP